MASQTKKVKRKKTLTVPETPEAIYDTYKRTRHHKETKGIQDESVESQPIMSLATQRASTTPNWDKRFQYRSIVILVGLDPDIMVKYCRFVSNPSPHQRLLLNQANMVDTPTSNREFLLSNCAMAIVSNEWYMDSALGLRRSFVNWLLSMLHTDCVNQEAKLGRRDYDGSSDGSHAYARSNTLFDQLAYVYQKTASSYADYMYDSRHYCPLVLPVSAVTSVEASQRAVQYYGTVRHKTKASVRKALAAIGVNEPKFVDRLIETHCRGDVYVRRSNDEIFLLTMTQKYYSKQDGAVCVETHHAVSSCLVKYVKYGGGRTALCVATTSCVKFANSGLVLPTFTIIELYVDLNERRYSFLKAKTGLELRATENCYTSQAFADLAAAYTRTPENFGPVDIGVCNELYVQGYEPVVIKSTFDSPDQWAELRCLLIVPDLLPANIVTIVAAYHIDC